MIGNQIIDDILEGEIGTKGTDIFLNFQNEEPNNQTSVYERPTSVLQESQGYNIDSVRIQLIVRDESEVLAKAKIKSAHLLLAAYRGTLSDGTIVRETYIITPPSFLKTDDKNRKEFTSGYTMNYTQTATALRPQV